MNKIKDIIWSVFMTAKLIFSYGIDGAEQRVNKMLHSERVKYWEKTSKHPNTRRKQ